MDGLLENGCVVLIAGRPAAGLQLVQFLQFGGEFFYHHR